MQGSPRIDELRQKFHENPRRYFAPLANEYRKAGDPEQAIAICRAHLAQQPGHMSGHVVYGQALYDARRPEEARSVFEKALSLDPDNAIVLKQLGDIAREKGESPEARHWYGKALDIDPMDSEVAAYIAELTEPLTGDAPDVLEEVEVEAQQGIEASSPADDQGDGFEEPAEATPEVVADAPEVESTFVISDAHAGIGAGDGHEGEPAAAGEVQATESVSAGAVSADAVSDDTAAADDSAADVAWRNTPKAEKSPFVTRTMAELYASQGYPDAALDIYRQLALQHPDDMEIRDRIDELSSGPEVSEPFSFAELTDDVIYQPTSEETSLTGDDPPSVEGVHFTEMSLSEGSGVEAGFADSEIAEVTEVSWEGSLADFSEISLDDPAEDASGSEPQHVLESTSDTEVEAVVEEAVNVPYLDAASGDTEPVDQELAALADAPATDLPATDLPATDLPATDLPATDLPAESAAEESASDARFVDLPVALGEFQTSIDEAGMAATSPHDSEITPAADPEVAAPMAESEPEPEADEEFRGDEAAAAMASGQPAPDDAESVEPPVEPDSGSLATFGGPGDEWGVEEPETMESEVVAYSPELPAPEDLPHYNPKSPTIREFFATLGARRPPDRGAAESFTARAAVPAAPKELPADDLPLATEAFDSLFPDDPPASEADTRAAFALSGALSGATHNPVPSSLRTSPPRPTPAVTEPSSEAQESEDDIRRFREWLDGLADS